MKDKDRDLVGEPYPALRSAPPAPRFPRRKDKSALLEETSSIYDGRGARRPRWRSVGKNDVGLKHHSKIDGKLLFLSIALSLLFSGCGKTRYTQCEQIFQIANRLSQNVDRLNYFDNQQPTETESWLEAASKIDRAANHLEALQINDSQLIEYQNKFVTVYRIYSQTTYDAVKARENKNFQALESIRNDARKAGQMQQDLIEEINAYCLKS